MVPNPYSVRKIKTLHKGSNLCVQDSITRSNQNTRLSNRGDRSVDGIGCIKNPSHDYWSREGVALAGCNEAKLPCAMSQAIATT